MAATNMSICHMCKHWRPGIGHPDGKQTCAAFPGGIPDPIWVGTQNHFQQVQGDNGIVFEPRPEITPETVEEFMLAQEAMIQ